MFCSCTALESLDVRGLDTGAVENMDSMFRECTALQELILGKMDTGSATNMYAMFWETPGVKLEDVKHFNTEKVENCEFFMNGTGWESLFKK